MMRVQSWNKILLVTCVMALLVDPIFFYIPQIDAKRKCLVLDRLLNITTCALRTFLDLFYIILHVMLQYLLSKFMLDILSIIPLPQVFVLVIIPRMYSSLVPLIVKDCAKYIVLVQYVPRIVRLYPFFREVTRTAGILTEKLWIAAAYNLLLYMIASHVVGSLWYILSVESEIRCWSQGLKNANISETTYMSCGHQNSTVLTLLNSSCPLKNPDDIDDPSVFNFGIYIDALRSRVVQSTTHVPHKIFYCLWWGLRNMSSLGQDLKTSTFIEEIFFTIFISIFGLILFAFLIGNVQKYLQSMQFTTARAEQLSVRKQNIEKWMLHRMLPEDLRERIRRYERYQWQENGGVDEETLIRNLPKDLRSDVKRHLCLHLLLKVPMFEIMDAQFLDALCDGLKPVLYTENTYIIREGDPVDQMVFFIQGNLESVTTHGGRTEVEAFALMANCLKLVYSQFLRLHNKYVQHTFRYYSLQWRTWAACFIQVAWSRHRKRKIEKSLREAEDRLQDALAKEEGSSVSFGATIYAARIETRQELISTKPSIGELLLAIWSSDDQGMIL
ncbi:hypothetical protein K1719_044808 [Acacia pycnantha]|nr:hypothetical protein K1719_044808 [Acacia pycnantha]